MMVSASLCIIWEIFRTLVFYLWWHIEIVDEQSNKACTLFHNIFVLIASYNEKSYDCRNPMLNCLLHVFHFFIINNCKRKGHIIICYICLYWKLTIFRYQWQSPFSNPSTIANRWLHMIFRYYLKKFLCPCHYWKQYIYFIFSDPKRGDCPEDSKPRNCVLRNSECKSDSQCSGIRKCCRFSCQNFCVDPKYEHKVIMINV